VAQDACAAHFTQGGSASSGLSFATFRTIPGLTPRDALAQYKNIAAAQGFEIGRDSYRGDHGELVISQLPSINARGFDMKIVADETGRIGVSTTLPPGMVTKPEAFRTNMCKTLGQLRSRIDPALRDSAASTPPAFAPTPQQSTDLCVANFISNGSTVEGQTFSTWSLGLAMDLPTAVERVKTFAAAAKGTRVTTETIHGNKASLTISMNNAAAINDGAFAIEGPDLRGFPMRIDLDASLNAASFTAHANAEQHGIDDERVRYIACNLIATAISAAPMPAKKKPSRFHLRNPFKNERKEAQKKMAANVQLIIKSRALLYRRATQADKAIVFMPLLNLGRKYDHATNNDVVPGGTGYPKYRFDETATLIWKAAGNSDDLIRAGTHSSLWEEGLFGYIQSMSANKTEYAIYIVDPGSYGLVGLTYELPNSSLPALSSRRWSPKPRLGTALFVTTRNAEFHDTQVWADAQYQNVSVVDGSYCAMMVTGGGVSGCANWQETSHTETRQTSAAGWRTLTTKGYAGGLTVSIKLARPFAHFEAKAGEVIVTDGFAATTDSATFDSNACHQAGDNLVDCNIKSFALFRIPGNKSELALSPETARKVPMVAGFAASATYRPARVDATRLEETPGTYEAAWAKPYALSAH
jgi:hypothetical protein